MPYVYVLGHSYTLRGCVQVAPTEFCDMPCTLCSFSNSLVFGHTHTQYIYICHCVHWGNTRGIALCKRWSGCAAGTCNEAQTETALYAASALCDSSNGPTLFSHPCVSCGRCRLHARFDTTLKVQRRTSCSSTCLNMVSWLCKELGGIWVATCFSKHSVQLQTWTQGLLSILRTQYHTYVLYWLMTTQSQSVPLSDIIKHKPCAAAWLQKDELSVEAPLFS